MSSTPPAPVDQSFDPHAFSSFRFLARTIDADGSIALHYALNDVHTFTERITVPMPGVAPDLGSKQIQGILSLLHLCAGVSYYKAAIPERVTFEHAPSGPATAALLEALYSEGLGEFAVVNGLAHLPHPRFSASEADAPTGTPATAEPRSVLVPVGGGKDSAVAIEIARASRLPVTLFSIGNAGAIQGTVDAAGLPRLQAWRTIDPHLIALNREGALNGHVPITAIVSCVALLTAALHGIDAVAFANERSASAGNTVLDGVEVNHQFSKSFRVEQLIAGAVAEIVDAPAIFSVLRPASELAIARRFAQLSQYHPVFTSCNRIFKIDESLRLSSWCGECDKCRFVFLILAPFMAPEQLKAIFGRAMLDDVDQYAGFALLTATGGHKPFECVGEVEDSVAALRLLAEDPRWADQRVLRRLLDEVLVLFPADQGRPEDVFTLSQEHLIPAPLADEVDALLGS